MWMKARSAKGVRAGRPTQASIVEVVRSREQLQVWLRDSRRRQLTGTIGIELASDAKRLGQDLVGTLVDRALREAERNRLVWGCRRRRQRHGAGPRNPPQGQSQ
jgi:hypothetical protein